MTSTTFLHAKQNMLIAFFVSWIVHIHSVSSGSSPSFDTCDGDSIPSSTSVASLNHNTFYKICPGTFSSNNRQLGQPICGDGTAFSFFFTKPLQILSNKKKILIEFQGGGACWDQDTCNNDNDELSFPQDLNNFVGYSCSALSYTDQEYNGYPINFLCDTEIGDVDFNEYNTVIIPYCTQDMHLGDNIVTYGNGDDDDGQNGNKVYHHGAHNVMGVLEWIFKNFPNPSHIALTGCSAGGSVLPVVYDLMYHHYNSLSKGGRSANINVMMDSPLYLTPQKFLYYGIDNWNPWTLIGKTKFNTHQNKDSVWLSTKLWEHILHRGSKKDKWGFLSHSNDPNSIEIWENMGGGNEYYDDYGTGDDADNKWYTALSASISIVSSGYPNTKSHLFYEEGTCSFGLYYALQDNDFINFAQEILKEQSVIGYVQPSFPFFLSSMLIGLGVVFLTLVVRNRAIEVDAEELIDKRQLNKSTYLQRMKAKQKLDAQKTKKKNGNTGLSQFHAFFLNFKSFPISTGYLVTTSVYFMFMLISGGFTHPISNPSLGPAATVLSSYGINNPSLIVYKRNLYRLIISTFLCSGLLTYLMVVIAVYRSMRRIEKVIDNSKLFIMICLFVALGSNLIYACVAEGASCGSLAFVIGLNIFSFTMRKKLGSEFPFPKEAGYTIFMIIITTLVFPFNSWIMIMGAAGVAVIIAYILERIESSSKGILLAIHWNHMTSFSFFLLFMFLLLALQLRTPSIMYERPFLTGCDMMISNDVQQIAYGFDDYYNGRKLGRDDYDNLCAQFCIPNVIAFPFYWGVRFNSNVYVARGFCQDVGYKEHVADNTFSYWDYELDIELYTVYN